MTAPDPLLLIATLQEQEQRLQLTHFTNDDAWVLGSWIMAAARDRGLPVTVDITRHGQQLFHAAMPGTNSDNDRWIERKIRVVDRFGSSSYLVGRRLAHAGRSLSEDVGTEPLLYAAHGGSFPILIRDVGPIGSITVSGLAQHLDHALVIEALEAFLEPLTARVSAARAEPR